MIGRGKNGKAGRGRSLNLTGMSKDGEECSDGREKTNGDGEVCECVKTMRWDWVHEMKDEGVRGRGKAVGQSAGFEGDDGEEEEEEQTDNPD